MKVLLQTMQQKYKELTDKQAEAITTVPDKYLPLHYVFSKP